MAKTDIELTAACAERLELEAELHAIGLEVSEHDAAREAELASHRRAVESLKSQVHEARGQLAAASEAVISLESLLTEERKARASNVPERGLSTNSAMVVAIDPCHPDAAEIAAVHAKLLAAGARANRKRELLAESEVEGAGLAELLKTACDARPEFAQLAHDASVRSAKAYISGRLAQLHDTKHNVGVIRAQLEQGKGKQNMGSPVSAQRLADLKTALADLQAEARSRADDVDILRAQASIALREAVEAETRLKDFEEGLRCGSGKEIAPRSPQQNKTAESPGASTRSPELGNIAANVSVSAVSRRLSFSPFDISRDFMPDVESPVIDTAGSLDVTPSGTAVGHVLTPIKPSFISFGGRQTPAEVATGEAVVEKSGEAQRRRLLALLQNAKKQFTNGS